MSDNYAISLKRSTALFAASAFLVMLTAANFSSLFSNKADAAQLSSRSLTLSTSLSGSETGDAVAGSATNGSAATHTFAYTAIGSATSTTFQYCTAAIGTCTTPTGLTMSGTPTASAGTAAYATGTITWTNSYGAGPVTVTFSGITNPTTTNTPFFVRIVTSGGDNGTVSSAITEGIKITSRVKETLGFSTTGQVDATHVAAPGTGCSALTGSGAITLGDPQDNALSINTAYDNYTAFRIYTNAANGVNIQYEGDTLKKGADDINALSSEVVSALSTEQFGLGVDVVSGGAGTSAPVSITSSATPLNLQYVDKAAELALDGPLAVNAAYDEGSGVIQASPTAKFNYSISTTPTTIASSTSYTNCKTVAVRYLANISPLTPAGTYTTTVVYSAVPTY